MCNKHTQACIDSKAAQDAWMVQHPYACTKCHGTGNDGKPMDPSVGMDYPDMCYECVGKGKCPVCGYTHDDDWEGCTCENPACNWDADDKRTWGPVFECYCWETFYAEEIEEETAKARAYHAARMEAEPVVMDDTFYRRADEEFDAARERGMRHGFARY